VISARGV